MAQGTGIYRDRKTVARIRVRQLLSRVESEAKAAHHSDGARVYRRRLARAAAGVVGAAGGAVMLLASGLSLIWFDDAPPLNVFVLAAALVSAALTYVVATSSAGRWLSEGLARLAVLSGDLDRDLERLERAQPAKLVRDSADRLAQLSIGGPLVAVALLGPLAVQFGVSAFPILLDNASPVEAFGPWMAISAAIVGHAHVALAFVSWRYAKRLLAGNAPRPVREGLVALGWTVLASCLPGILLIGLPPLLTAATGVVLVLPAFYWAHRAAASEHALLLGACRAGVGPR